MAKVSRRGFFGRAVGGFAAALGLAKVASGPSRLDVLFGSTILTPPMACNVETGTYLTSNGHWDYTYTPISGDVLHGYFTPDNEMVWTSGPPVGWSK